MLKGRKKVKQGRNPRVEYKKQQSYHYSSRRSVNDRAVNRQQVTLDDSRDSKKVSKRPLSKYLPSYAAILLVLIGLYYLFTLSSNPKITIINDNSKTQLISKDLLQKKAQDELNKSFFNKFKPTFNEDKLEKELLKLSPEIVSIEVETGVLKHNPQIKVEFSEPTALLSTGSNLYIIGSDGKVLADITKNKAGFKVDNLPLLQDQSSIPIEVSKKALTSSQLFYIQEINFQSSQKKLNVSSIIIQPGGSQLDVKYAGQNYYVKYNFFEDARKSSGVFIALKEKLDSEGTVPAEYIDVRVPERAYIK